MKFLEVIQDELFKKALNFRDEHITEVEDFETACDTKVYLRTLSFRKIPKKFLETLIIHKSKLMSELDLTNNEYDELMILALGILAVESKMGTSFKYHLKEDIRIGGYNIGQMAINYVKRKGISEL